MNYIKLVLLTIVLSASSLITSGCAGRLYIDGDSGYYSNENCGYYAIYLCLTFLVLMALVLLPWKV
jgi:uncharacterized membrane protein